MKYPPASSTILALLAAGVLTACKHSPSQYISPRVTGRVVDAQTHQPIENVYVRRVTGGQNNRSDQLKGAQQIQLPAPIRTRADGTFVVDSSQTLAFFRSVGWYSVTLSYEHTGYQDLVASYSLSESTNTPTGEPWVKAGDVLLEPVSK